MSGRSGLAVLCDARGTVLELVRDDIGVSDHMQPGRPFPVVVERESMRAALDFLQEIRSQRAAFDCELTVVGERGPETLCFTGGSIEGKLLLVGERDQASPRSFYDELMRINNEQLNTLRAALKDNARAGVRSVTPAPAPMAVADFEAFTELNNALTNAQRELARNNAELARLDRQKNELLGMAAHDLRNPLGVIQGYAELLVEELADEPDVRLADFDQIIDRIRTSSEFMLRLVNDLLDVARIASGCLELELAEADIVDIAERAVAMNEPFATRKSIGLAVDSEPGLPSLTIDGHKTEQVLNNLLSNAIKYSHTDTQIRVTIAVVDDGGSVEVGVIDQGQGIPAEEQDRLFGAFSRTSVKGTAGEKSTGLGLSIAHKIVEGHGGRMRVESEVGVGSTFAFTLPVGTQLRAVG